MPKIQFTPQIWLGVAIAGYVIPTVLAYFFVLDPMFTESLDSRLERVAADEYLVLKNAADQLTQFKQDLGIRNQIRTFRSVFDSLVTASEVKLVSIRVDTLTETLGSGFVLRTYELILEGQYSQLARFVDSLEKPNEYYLISNVALSRIDDKTGRAQAELILVALAAVVAPSADQADQPPPTSVINHRRNRILGEANPSQVCA
jgi:hypothetical protein